MVFARELGDGFECLGRGGKTDNFASVVHANMQPIIKNEAGNNDGADGIDEPGLGVVVRESGRDDGEGICHDVVFVVFGESFGGAADPGQGAGVEIEGDFDPDSHKHDADGDGFHV